MENNVDMQDDNHREELAFFGKIIASLSHEIMNVLATQKELSGLLGDLVWLSGNKGTPIDLAKLGGIGEKLNKQAGRGEEIVRRLNKFSHSVDDLKRQVNIKSLIEDVVKLCRRYAVLQKIEISVDLSDADYLANIYPFAFYQAAFMAIYFMILGSDAGDSISVKFTNEISHCQILISSNGRRIDWLQGLEMDPLLLKLVHDLNGEMKRDGRRIYLTFH